MQNFFIGDDWNGRKVTKDNVKEFIKHNPEAVNAYLEMYGMGFLNTQKTQQQTATQPTATGNKQDVAFPDHISQIPENEMVTDSEIEGVVWR
jgi:hypothetical protein